MTTILLTVHVIIALALIGLVLIQRSDSDGFGLGSGSGANILSGRGKANFLTRTTAILATLFMLNSLLLGVIAARTGQQRSILDRMETSAPTSPNAITPATGGKAGDPSAMEDAAPENADAADAPVDKSGAATESLDETPNTPAPQVPVAQ